MVTTTVAKQHIITNQKKSVYPIASWIYPANIPGIIMLSAMNAVQIGIVGCFEFTFGEVRHVEHVGRETEAVAELLDGDGGGDGKQIVGLGNGKIDKRQAWQSHASCHPPDGFFQANRNANDPSKMPPGEEYDSDGAVYDTYFCCR